MKTKGTNNLATKDDIKLLKTDIKRLETDIKRLEVNIKSFRLAVDEKLSAFDARLTKFEHTMNDRFDEIIKEVRESREDRVLVVHRVGIHDEQLYDHEKRLVGLEKRLV